MPGSAALTTQSQEQGKNVNVKEMPRWAQKTPVVKGTFLGWLRHYATGEPGYFCVVMTHDKDAPDSDKSFQVHVMWAAGLDKPWKEHETHTHLPNGAANHLLAEWENLAEWPEGK